MHIKATSTEGGRYYAVGLDSGLALAAVELNTEEKWVKCIQIKDGRAVWSKEKSAFLLDCLYINYDVVEKETGIIVAEVRQNG